MGALLDEIWAKSPGKGETSGETLVRHTERVVGALIGIMELRPDLPAVVGCDRLWHRAYWACCFHDLGKAARGFQRQLRTDTIWGQRHEVLSLGFLRWLDLDDDDLLWIAAAVASHHRDAKFIEKRYGWDLDDKHDELVSMTEDIPDMYLEPLHRWVGDWANGHIASQGLHRFGVCPVPLHPLSALDSTPEERRRSIQQFLERYAGLVNRLRGRRALSEDVMTGLMLRGIVISADRMGSAHAKPLEPVNLDGVDGVLHAMGETWDSLYDHQRAAATCEGDVVLTAPTASGKTEAGLLWAVAQQDRVPRLLYMLPYQASINAMKARLSSYVVGQQVGLQHGRALHALYRRLLEDDPEPRRAAAIARRENDLTRLNHPPVRVLTPYQILKACYRLKGYEAILSDLVDASVIVDEIHSYEAKRLAMILGMARYLKRRLGTRWFIMSATLPALVKDAVSEALDQPYRLRATKELYACFRRHLLEVRNGNLEDHLDEVIKAADGSRVLVCCNTVKKAQDVYDLLANKLESRPITVEVLHGRLNGRDRLHRERLVEEAAPAESGGPPRSLIVVATQVIEVSLNLSFDVVFTEPAPLDALLQRFGRVNRLPGGGLRPVHVFTEPQDGQGVYSGDVVARTVQLLRQHSGEPIDEAQTQGWIDEIYSGTLADEWRKEYREALTAFEWSVLDALRPFQSDDQLEDLFYEAFDSQDVLPISFEAQFDRESEESPVEAGELLVPIRHATLEKLIKKNRARRRSDRIWVVDVPYSDPLGLRVKDA